MGDKSFIEPAKHGSPNKTLKILTAGALRRAKRPGRRSRTATRNTKRKTASRRSIYYRQESCYRLVCDSGSVLSLPASAKQSRHASQALVSPSHPLRHCCRDRRRNNGRTFHCCEERTSRSCSNKGVRSSFAQPEMGNADLSLRTCRFTRCFQCEVDGPDPLRLLIQLLFRKVSTDPIELSVIGFGYRFSQAL